jgi:hypothetical protein
MPQYHSQIFCQNITNILPEYRADILPESPADILPGYFVDGHITGGEGPGETIVLWA